MEMTPSMVDRAVMFWTVATALLVVEYAQ